MDQKHLFEDAMSDNIAKKFLLLENYNAIVLSKYFGMKKELKQTTMDKYMNYFLLVEDLLIHYESDNMSVKSKSPQNDILKNIPYILKMFEEYVSNENVKPEMAKQFLQVINTVKPSKKLKTAIGLYTKKTNEYYKDKTQKQLLNTSITYKQLAAILKDKNVEDNDFVLFYLLISYGVRNMDLVIALTGQEGNYMLWNDKSIRYVRTDYKTFDKYGMKKIGIKHPRFVQIIKQYIMNGKQYLFENNKNNPYQSDDMTNYINSRFNHYLNTDERISEGLIYKIVNSHYAENNDTKSQIKLADHRGHELETQEKYYE